MFSQHQNKQCRLACLSPLHPQSQNCISTFECWGVALLHNKNMKDITLLNRATFLHVWNMNQNHSSPLTGALRSYSKKKTTFFFLQPIHHQKESSKLQSWIPRNIFNMVPRYAQVPNTVLYTLVHFCNTVTFCLQ